MKPIACASALISRLQGVARSGTSTPTKTLRRIVVLASLVPSLLSAQTTVLTWDNTGTVNTATPVTGVTGYTFTGGSGVTVDTSGAFTAKASAALPWSLADAQTGQIYMEFSLDVSSAVLTLSTLDIAYDGATAGPQQLDILVSVDGGTYQNIFHDGSVSAGAESNTGIDLSGVSAIASSAVFRVYFYNVNSDNHLSLSLLNASDAVSLQGTVTAVPEPATTAALIGMCVLSLVVWRRRQSHQA